MNTFFLDLFRYNNDANNLIVEAMNEHPNAVTDRCLGLMSHVLNVHQIWNCKILSIADSFDPWKSHAIMDLNAFNKRNFENTLLILSGFELNKLIMYSTRSGQTYTSSVSEILFHTINHSTYHRGQIATEFRNMRIEPKMTDYILFRMQPAFN
jgi:uncharacterized damage-inducible protein DinB